MKVLLVTFFIACLPSAVYSEGSVEFCYNLPSCNGVYLDSNTNAWNVHAVSGSESNQTHVNVATAALFKANEFVRVYYASVWSTLAPRYCNGTRQSPINIVTADVKVDNKLTAFNFSGFNDSANLLHIQNIGKSVKIELDSLNMGVSGGGLEGQYNSTQVHFHWGNTSSVKGSEHTVDGRQYAMEMHIVNKAYGAVNTSVEFAVLGFFIEETNDTGKPESWKNLTSFFSRIYNASGSSLDIMHELTADSLLQGVDRTKYYRYLGSLTTPSCNESVVWTVFKDSIKVSKDLIDLFSNTVRINTTADPFITNNYRPVQSLNGRVVTSQPTASLSTSPTNTASLASTRHCVLSISTVLLYSVLFLYL